MMLHDMLLLQHVLVHNLSTDIFRFIACCEVGGHSEIHVQEAVERIQKFVATEAEHAGRGRRSLSDVVFQPPIALHRFCKYFSSR